jgi:hypothetical protein
MIVIRVVAQNAYRAHGELLQGEDGVLSLRDPESIRWPEAMNRISCD